MLEFALCCGLSGIAEMIWFLIEHHGFFFAGYFPSHGRDPFMVATHSDGGQGAFGYWIYPLGDGSSGYLQPVWMTVI